MAFIHCSRCVNALPLNRTPEQYSELTVEATNRGLLITCKRHRQKVALITPELLLDLMHRSDECDLCKQGVPHSHQS
jgi:hypothetical protein